MREQETDTRIPAPPQDVTAPSIPLIEISHANNDDDIRALALVALDDLREVIEGMSDDPVNASRAAALRQETEKVRADVLSAPRGSLSRGLVNRVNACLREVSIACTEVTFVSNRSHAQEKAILGDVAIARREAETEVQVAIANIERRAVEEAIAERRATEAREAQARRTVVVAGVVVAGGSDSVAGRAQRGAVNLVRRGLGDRPADILDRGLNAVGDTVDEVVQDASTGREIQSEGWNAMTSGNRAGARQAALDGGRAVRNATGNQQAGAIVTGALQTGATAAEKASTTNDLASDAIDAVRERDWRRAGEVAVTAREAGQRNVMGLVDGAASIVGLNRLDNALAPLVGRLRNDPNIDWENLITTIGRDSGSHTFDINGNGHVSVSELASVLRNNRVSFDAIDTNDDNRISYQELTAAMMRIARRNEAVAEHRLTNK